MKRLILIICIFGLVSVGISFGACPSFDLSGDCEVNLEDFAIMSSGWLITYSNTDLSNMASEWLTKSYPEDPANMVWVSIPGGTFQMGDSFSESSFDELPVHNVTLSSFNMSKYEITNGQYCEYLNSAYPSQIKNVDGVIYAVSDNNNSYSYCNTYASNSLSQIEFIDGVFSVRVKGGRSMINDPVVLISWYGAKAFCDYYAYRLPTEAEWEYAARGSLSDKRFPWGDTITHSQGNYYSSSSYSYDVSPTRGYPPAWNDGIYPYTSPVGSYSANGFGLHDMAGNAWEWCSDWYGSDYYSISPETDPAGPATGSYRIMRGGGWNYRANNCRIANRGFGTPDYRDGDDMGFRVCKD